MEKDANATMITGATSAPYESITSIACSGANKENINPKPPRITHLINHKGYVNTKKVAEKKHILHYCRNNRGGKNSQCSVTLKLSHDNEVLSVKGEHGHKCNVDNPTMDTGVVEENIRKSGNFDFSTTMHKRAVELALNDVGAKPQKIRDKIYTEMNQKADVWRGLTDAQVKERVKSTRNENSGSDFS